MQLRVDVGQQVRSLPREQPVRRRLQWRAADKWPDGTALRVRPQVPRAARPQKSPKSWSVPSPQGSFARHIQVDDREETWGVLPVDATLAEVRSRLTEPSPAALSVRPRNPGSPQP